MNRGNLKCSFKCNSDESKDHNSQSCTPILEKLDNKEIPPLGKIFETPEKQKTAIKVFFTNILCEKTTADARLVHMNII